MSVSDNEKKLAIKQAARDLFLQFGYTKTSMNDIARQTGLAKPTLYYYYSGKETIFDEVVVEEAQKFMDAIETRMPANIKADRKLRFLLLSMYQDLKIYAEKMSDLPQYLCEHSPHGHPIVKKIEALLAEKLLPILRKGKEEGIFEYKNEKITVATLVFMTEFINIGWIKHYPAAMCDKVIETMIKTILNGLRRSN